MAKRVPLVSDEREWSWLPIDSRLFLPLFSFGHVKGIAKAFLVLEFFFSSLVVVGTISILIILGIEGLGLQQ